MSKRGRGKQKGERCSVACVSFSLLYVIEINIVTAMVSPRRGRSSHIDRRLLRHSTWLLLCSMECSTGLLKLCYSAPGSLCTSPPHTRNICIITQEMHRATPQNYQETQPDIIGHYEEHKEIT